MLRAGDLAAVEGEQGAMGRGFLGGCLMGGFCRDSFAWHRESNGQTCLLSRCKAAIILPKATETHRQGQRRLKPQKHLFTAEKTN